MKVVKPETQTSYVLANPLVTSTNAIRGDLSLLKRKFAASKRFDMKSESSIAGSHGNEETKGPTVRFAY